jgi:hypothetical protein
MKTLKRRYNTENCRKCSTHIITNTDKENFRNKNVKSGKSLDKRKVLHKIIYL